MCYVNRIKFSFFLSEESAPPECSDFFSLACFFRVFDFASFLYLHVFYNKSCQTITVTIYRASATLVKWDVCSEPKTPKNH